MKTSKLKTITILLASVLFIGVSQVQAQKGQMRGKGQGLSCNIPDLTEEQQKKIDDLRVDHQKKMLNNRNLMQEKKAKLNTLRTAEKADMNAINKIIDEMGTLHTQMMKDREAHRQTVRGLLNEKQRLFYDTHKGRGFKAKGMGQSRGRGHQRMGYNCPNK